MLHALKLLGYAVAGFAVGALLSTLLNMLYAALVALLGSVLGTALYMAACVALGFFGMRALMRSAVRYAPSTARSRAVHLFIR